jgi:hypothetical protein
LGALGAANAIVTIISGKDYLGYFSDFVMGGLRLDPEARLRVGEGLQITPEDRRAAERVSLKRQIDSDYKRLADKLGISVEELKRRNQEYNQVLIRSGDVGPSIGPAR